MENINEKVKDLMEEKLGISKTVIEEQQDFRKDLAVDSLDLFEFFEAAERQFSIAIPDEIAEKLFTVEQLIQYIKDQKN